MQGGRQVSDTNWRSCIIRLGPVFYDCPDNATEPKLVQYIKAYSKDQVIVSAHTMEEDDVGRNWIPLTLWWRTCIPARAQVDCENYWRKFALDGMDFVLGDLWNVKKGTWDLGTKTVTISPCRRQRVLRFHAATPPRPPAPSLSREELQTSDGRVTFSLHLEWSKEKPFTDIAVNYTDERDFEAAFDSCRFAWPSELHTDNLRSSTSIINFKYHPPCYRARVIFEHPSVLSPESNPEAWFGSGSLCSSSDILQLQKEATDPILGRKDSFSLTKYLIRYSSTAPDSTTLEACLSALQNEKKCPWMQPYIKVGQSSTNEVDIPPQVEFVFARHRIQFEGFPEADGYKRFIEVALPQISVRIISPMLYGCADSAVLVRFANNVSGDIFQLIQQCHWLIRTYFKSVEIRQPSVVYTVVQKVGARAKVSGILSGRSTGSHGGGFKGTLQKTPKGR